MLCVLRLPAVVLCLCVILLNTGSVYFSASECGWFLPCLCLPVTRITEKLIFSLPLWPSICATCRCRHKPLVDKNRKKRRNTVRHFALIFTWILKDAKSKGWICFYFTATLVRIHTQWRKWMRIRKTHFAPVQHIKLGLNTENFFDGPLLGWHQCSACAKTWDLFSSANHPPGIELHATGCCILPKVKISSHPQVQRETDNAEAPVYSFITACNCSQMGGRLPLTVHLSPSNSLWSTNAVVTK